MKGSRSYLAELLVQSLGSCSLASRLQVQLHCPALQAGFPLQQCCSPSLSVAGRFSRSVMNVSAHLLMLELICMQCTVACIARSTDKLVCVGYSVIAGGLDTREQTALLHLL